MPLPDLDRINELAKKLDDLCRQSAEIRAALARATAQRAAWPAPHSVVPVVIKSALPSEFNPTSTVKRANN
jgi:hypothetical protein